MVGFSSEKTAVLKDLAIVKWEEKKHYVHVNVG